MFDHYKVHGIYGLATGGGTCSGAFGSAVRDGDVYTELIAMTGGVVAGSQVSCEINVPQPAGGGSNDPTQINVEYVGGTGTTTTLPQAADGASCPAGGARPSFCDLVHRAHEAPISDVTPIR